MLQGLFQNKYYELIKTQPISFHRHTKIKMITIMVCFIFVRYYYYLLYILFCSFILRFEFLLWDPSLKRIYPWSANSLPINKINTIAQHCESMCFFESYKICFVWFDNSWYDLVISTIYDHGRRLWKSWTIFCHSQQATL